MHFCNSFYCLVTHPEIQRQKNMDYCTTNAMAYNTRDPVTGEHIDSVLVCYDVACQYSVHFPKRCNDSPILRGILLLFTATVYWAIGKFHLGAHKEDCYPKYSLNHKEGSGRKDGEDAERDWADLQAVMFASRTGTLPTREEKVGNAMQYLNFRIIVCLGLFSFSLPLSLIH